MNQSFFQTQINRLAETFGPTAYKRERVELLWREVKDLSDAWFRFTVDRFIGECRHAPLLPEFRDAVAQERERSWTKEKKQNELDAKAFFSNQIFDDEIRRSICQTILDRLNHKVDDKTWNNFVDGIEKLAGGRCA